MDDVVEAQARAGEPGRSPQELAALKQITMVVYAFQALSFFWGLPALIAVIINYIKREDARGTLYESHFDWQIRTFWWGLLWAVVGVVLAVVLVGFLVMTVSWLWMLYRVIKGWLKLTEGKPVMPA